MKVVAFAGESGSGKTTIVERLIPALKARGQRVSVIKHAHHRFDMDHPGKDTWRHRQAGAFEVLAASSQRLMLVREFEQPREPEVQALLATLDPGVDWVLVEGFKNSELPKVEVWRPASGHAPRYVADPHIVAVATDSPQALPSPTRCPVLDLNQPEELADWLLHNGERFDHNPVAHR